MARNRTSVARPHPLLVFLCHASDDKPEVLQIYNRLREDGVELWLDQERLLPGQDWELEISKAVRKADIVIVFLSPASVTKDGFVQKEIRTALDVADNKPEGTIFIIPARLEDCEIPDRLKHLHRVDLFSEQGYERLMQSIELRGRITAQPHIVTRYRSTTQSSAAVDDSRFVLDRPRRIMGVKREAGGKVRLSNDDRSLLREILYAKGLTQKELASRTDVTQPWLSQVLSGRRTNVSEVALDRIATVLLEYLKRRKGEKGFSNERASAAIGLLTRFSKTAGELLRPKIFRPGGPVPVDADHFIDRDADSEALQALLEWPFTMLVSGPVQCGKSSLFVRLAQKAREQGIEAAWFDPRLPALSPLPDGEQRTEINAIAFSTLSDLLQSQWGLDPPRQGGIDSPFRLLAWLLTALAPTASKPRLLIIDDLARLGAASMEDWMLLVRAMNNSSVRGELAVSVAVGLTTCFGPNLGKRMMTISSITQWSPWIKLGWFDRQHVTQFAFSINGDARDAADNYAFFLGQPYLTHAAARGGDLIESVRRWIDKPSESTAQLVRETQAYRQHLNGIRFSIFGPTRESTQETRALLQSFVEACSGSVPRDGDHRLFLQSAKLINAADEPSLPIYRLIANDLVDSIAR
jgi:transcriptional regulator with XRE-family HTH domain